MTSHSGDGDQAADLSNGELPDEISGYEEEEPTDNLNDAQDVEDEGPDLESELAEFGNSDGFRFPGEDATPMTEDGPGSLLPSGAQSPYEQTAPRGFESPQDSGSIPDDTPSVRGSVQSFPIPTSTPDSRSSSRLAQFSPNQPFERRFHARKTSLQLAGPRSISPAFLNAGSRHASHSSQLSIAASDAGSNASQEQPWEVVRWTKLKKISSHAFAESGLRKFGRPSYLAVSANIAIGTSKGLILIFDYQQVLRGIIGQGTAATESGSVTSLAISADHSVIASGHANGSIFTWEIARPAKPFLQIPPMPRSHLRDRTSDGHLLDSPVIHVGFLGTRHTALVSADDTGMAFSHLATRGLGALGRVVRTTRILGRYPNTTGKDVVSRKPSSVLAFSPLPLGNVEQSTDSMGLTALLTPYLLVIVSTTPVAQTQFKTPRSKDITAHGAMTGCLAWFPAVQLKTPQKGGLTHSRSKLVWCWSDVLKILEIHETPKTGDEGQDQPPALDFKTISRWKCDESITAVQWLSRSVLAVLTVTQRLIILEDKSMRVADSSDLNPRHIYHHDFFSRQLQPLVEKTEHDENAMHGVVSDAYHMSFKAYKGRLFVLGVADISMGNLSNWADRLVALMDLGRLTDAIELATSYYVGDSERVTIGLPDEDHARHEIVSSRLIDMLNASLDYVFNADQNDTLGKDIRSALQELSGPMFAACLTIEHTGFLFDRIFEAYSEASCHDIFLYTMEPYILDGQIDFVPPVTLKLLIEWYAVHDLRARLEEILLSLRTETMDIDQITGLCKTYGLYDALIYIWNQALQDYVTPMITLLQLDATNGDQDDPDLREIEAAARLFPYLAYTLTGRRYPDEAEVPIQRAFRAKASIYAFIFSDRAVRWPEPDGPLILLAIPSPSQNYPYLRHILRFDSSNFLSMLNEVFDDAFLDPHPEGDASVEDETSDDFFAGARMNRQMITNILLEMMNAPEITARDRIFICTFIARNLAKFNSSTASILVRGGSQTQQRLLVELCQNQDPELADECQLSVEYLLTIYQPTNISEIVDILKGAGFIRVLRSVYKKQRQYINWLDATYDDFDEPDAVFECIRYLFKQESSLNAKQLSAIKELISSRSKDLVTRGPAAAAHCLLFNVPELLDDVFKNLEEGSVEQFQFLEALLEPQEDQQSVRRKLPKEFETSFIEYYVELMCKHKPQRVTTYVDQIDTADLNLNRLLPAFEQGGVIDAAVKLMAHEGETQAAMKRLVKHLSTLQVALTGLIENQDHDMGDTDEAVDDLLEEIFKYSKLGIWLCQRPSTMTKLSEAEEARFERLKAPAKVTEADLNAVEALWLDILTSVVSISRSLGNASASGNRAQYERASDRIRIVIQQTFTALLAMTSHPSSRGEKTDYTKAQMAKEHGTARFLPILRCFLARAASSSPTLSDLRKVLADIFTAYAFEENMLSLSNSFVDRDVFGQVAEAEQRRRRGWKAKSVGCEGCRKRVWGAGVGEEYWTAWKTKKEKRRAEDQSRLLFQPPQHGESATSAQDKGKGRAAPVVKSSAEASGEANSGPEALVLFACTHLWHRKCLQTAAPDDSADRSWRCPIC